MRGKPSLSIGNPRGDRLIPACAGKTRGHFPNRYSVRAHPRVCGENMFLTPSQSCCQGSSPRVRGKPAWATRAGVHSGLIPARAGKTIKTPTVTKLCRAHPRVCGENYDKVKAEFFAEGSSPRVRGKQPAGRQPPPGLGLIPACAGKTHSDFLLLRAWWAHPRVCGENFLLCSDGFWHEGSSPRVRGKPGITVR